MSLLAELKRRKVVRVAVVYAATAFAVLQAAEIMLPRMGVPEWGISLVIALIVLGFPIALVLGWALELTPDGIKRTEAAPAGPSEAATPALLGKRTVLASALLVAVGIGLGAGWLLKPAGPGIQEGAVPSSGVIPISAPPAIADPAEKSIAVLPFLNMSPDPDNAFFADGIAEELLNVLSRIDGLRVASRTSAFSFKGKDVPIPEVARLLDVRHVLEGSVRRQGQRVRITAQLIDSATDGQVWSQVYDRELADIFAVQEEIAQAITGELGGILGQRKVTVSAPTAQLEAYERFLRGRARFHQRTELRGAIVDLAMAVELDPEFSEAWVYLAAAQAVAPSYETAPDFAADEAAAAVSLVQARRLAPQHPMALAVQGYLSIRVGDFVGGLEQLRESARTSAQDSNPLMWLGLNLLRAGYIDEAIASLERAEHMDPRVGINLGYLAMAYLSDGQRARAEAKAELALELGWIAGARIVALDMAARGERARALSLLTRVFSQSDRASADLDDALLAAIGDPSQFDSYLSLSLSSPTLRSVAIESGIVMGHIDVVLDSVERSREGDREFRDPGFWLRAAWLPGPLTLREDPWFFAFAEDHGLVRLWETRGYPPGCQRVSAPGGDHLDCPGMRR
jgi:TolB-like protein/tetratricopeptide (TPR) repeat protein